jgi:ABC-type oligopeptide transport system substrate-binding subunit
MKSKIIIAALAASISILSACGGDHSSDNGKDTVNNRFGAKDTSKVDTSKATSADNSASGGSALVDTTKKKDPAKK